jgi:hypothetical protein
MGALSTQVCELWFSRSRGSCLCQSW